MFELMSTDGLPIKGYAWLTTAPARGAVQIAHGMGEHAKRYVYLAEKLNAKGYHAYAADHRGHGASMHAGPGVLGPDGWNMLVADMVDLTNLIRERHPGLPIVLFGHSMGSFAAQQYVLDHADLIDALVLSGTTALDQLLVMLASVEGDAFAALNQSFEPSRTPMDWLSRDENQVDAYIADPLCGFALDAAGMADMGASAARLVDPASVPADLPIYVMVGEKDPLNAGLADSDLAVQRYREAGVAAVTYRTYPGARHEVVNETNRDDIIGDLIAWIDQSVRAPAAS